MVNGVHVAQNSGGWTPDANDAISRAAAAMSSIIPIPSEDFKLLVDSSALARILPADAMDLLRHGGNDGTGFHLGFNAFIGNSLGVLDVPKSSLADNIGIRSGDQLISYGDKTFASLADFKRLVKANVGLEINVTLLRGGKQQQVKMKIPNQLPK